MSIECHAHELIDTLRDSRDEFERMASARSLASLGAGAACAAPELAALLESAKAPVAAAAAFVLAEMGRPALSACPDLLQALMAQLSHPDGEVRHWSAVAMGRLGELAAPAASRLAELLSDPDEGILLAVMHALYEIGPPAREAAPRLLKLLEHSSSPVRQAAIKALLQVDPAGDVTRNGLIEAMAASPPRTRVHASLVVLRMSRMPEYSRSAALSCLIECLEAAAPQTRQEAAAGLGQLPSPPEAVVRALAKLLQDRYESVRYEAMQALLHMGEAAKPALAQMVAALDDPEDRVRHAAILAIERVAPKTSDPDVVEGMAKRLEDPSPLVQAAALAAFPRICRDESFAASKLAQRLQCPDEHVRAAAADAMRHISPSETVLSALRGALNDECLLVRINAAFALAKHGAPYEEAHPTFALAIESQDAQAQVAALNALKMLGAVAAPAAVLVEQKCQDKNAFIRGIAEAVLQEWKK